MAHPREGYTRLGETNKKLILFSIISRVHAQKNHTICKDTHTQHTEILFSLLRPPAAAAIEIYNRGMKNYTCTKYFHHFRLKFITTPTIYSPCTLQSILISLICSLNFSNKFLISAPPPTKKKLMKEKNDLTLIVR